MQINFVRNSIKLQTAKADKSLWYFMWINLVIRTNMLQMNQICVIDGGGEFSLL